MIIFFTNMKIYKEFWLRAAVELRKLIDFIQGLTRLEIETNRTVF